MAKVSKETQEMNKRWVEKQKEIKKTYSSYYVGGFIILLIIGVLFGYLYFFR